MPFRSLQLIPLAEPLAIARLRPGAALPAWAHIGELVSISKTADELSIVCAANSVPADAPCERPFSGIRVCGPLAFSETGVLASIALPLAQAGVSLFAVSTYATDYVLVPHADLERALSALESAGHKVAKLADIDAAPRQ